MTSNYKNTDSHNANYEVSLAGVPPAKTPEPSALLGLLGVIGAFTAQKQLKKPLLKN